MSETDKEKLMAWAEDYIAYAQGFGDPKAMSETDKEKLMTWAEDYVACAQKLEAWWMPAPTMVRWLVISNSHVLKTALRLKYPDKVVISDIVPLHANILTPTSDTNSSSASSSTQATKAKGASTYIDIVVDWLLLASTDVLLLSHSGFSHSAAFFSQRLTSAYVPKHCNPEIPVDTRAIGRIWSGI
ncbi:unnamed protein product [Closterium sp. NIES-65]|nr:unnamed protein product [Closterium sp. NIES-65]